MSTPAVQVVSYHQPRNTPSPPPLVNIPVDGFISAHLSVISEIEFSANYGGVYYTCGILSKKSNQKFPHELFSGCKVQLEGIAIFNSNLEHLFGSIR